MRRALALPAVALAAACTTPSLADPSILVSPYYALYELRGNIGMRSESATPGAPPEANANQPLRTFGQDRTREDVGARVDIGDGFGGFRLDYFRLDMNTSRNGVLDDDFGRLQSGDVVRMYASMDEVRAGWIQPLYETTVDYRERPLRLRFGAGGVLGHRDMRLRTRTDDGVRTQNLTIDGSVVYVAARFGAEWRELSLEVDYAYSPELSLSGDFEDTLQDLEGRISYRLPQRDVTFFAGYRFSELPARGAANGLPFDADLEIAGFQLGLTVTF